MSRCKCQVVPSLVRFATPNGEFYAGARAGGGSVRAGGRIPWGAKGEYAFRAGYDCREDLSFDNVVVPGCSAMLVQLETLAA